MVMLKTKNKFLMFMRHITILLSLMVNAFCKILIVFTCIFMD